MIRKNKFTLTIKKFIFLCIFIVNVNLIIFNYYFLIILSFFKYFNIQVIERIKS